MLDAMLDAPSVSKETAVKMITTYKLTDSGNSEIRFRYQRLALKCGCGPDEATSLASVEFLKEQGNESRARAEVRARVSVWDLNTAGRTLTGTLHLHMKHATVHVL